MFKRICKSHPLQIVFGPYIVEEEVFALSRVLLICFSFQHTECHSVENSGSCSCQKGEKETQHFVQTGCVWIVYKVALKDIHEGLVELQQYYTSANIDVIVSD
ncbi:uncharacterized protein Gasu_62060 [Galdieria sulphuraria]|uniref:Uncharacterized protein n=1 Tax=Galdieria sulphuraria TaxID=130081 RepID=M2XR55_GALSU|nr:uncharacterized protein Gasu_62060 [Galdieria sulphuraria]EME26148.1 hypothetical protein Gasu_62060 [Galdieria sulphuraria]|eukprot:XP_005702668.1 hypothetical protein Gasu_62060 [Galdieria sulphuraria]